MIKELNAAPQLVLDLLRHSLSALYIQIRFTEHA